MGHKNWISPPFYQIWHNMRTILLFEYVIFLLIWHNLTFRTFRVYVSPWIVIVQTRNLSLDCIITWSGTTTTRSKCPKRVPSLKLRVCTLPGPLLMIINIFIGQVLNLKPVNILATMSVRSLQKRLYITCQRQPN